MSRSLDDAMDDDDRYDLLREDGWSNADITTRRFLVAGRYLGPRDDQQDPEDDGDTAA